MRARLILILGALTAVTLPAHADDGFHDGDKAFAKAREVLRKQYVDDKLDDERMWRAATAGMLHGAGDGHWDKLLSPTELAALKADIAGEVVGLGVQISVDEAAGIANVDGVVPGSAAERAGLAVGDKILKLDGKPLKGLNHMQVSLSIRGKAGTPVTLTLLRDAEIITKTVKRAPFTLDPVSTMTLPGGVGLVKLCAFTDKTPSLLKTALTKLHGAGVRALIVDVRNNEGGVYDRMLECAGELLPRGSLVVTALHRGGKAEDKRTSTEPLISVPTTVLVNGATSSGAEILAGALKQSGARLVGKRTHGKWNAQTIEELGNGWAMKFTVAVFRTPWGTLPDGRGIDPDVEVEMSEHDVVRADTIKDAEQRLAADPQLRVAVNLLKLAK